MRNGTCLFPRCTALATHAAADDSAEWQRVCETHLGCSYRPDAWTLIERPLRALDESEVTFSIELEPEVCAPDFDDPETMAFIRRRLANEQHEAWCSLTVTAKWTHPTTGKIYEGSSCLGGVSIDAGRNASGTRVAKHVETFARDAELDVEALNDLNETLRARIVEAHELIVALRSRA